MPIPTIDTHYLIEFLTTLLNIPSPTGYTDAAVQFVENSMRAFPALRFKRTHKGALIAAWTGAETDDHPRALTAHTDTLGAMIKEIKPNGRLKLTKIGGFAWNTIEGEGCTIFTSQGSAYRGSLLFTKPSAHVNGADVGDLKREDDNMEVRLDARTSSENDTLALGVAVGDFVAFDARVEVTNGFVRSRHLDDKAGVACILSAVKTMADAGLRPAHPFYLQISNFEEVGHGASVGIPSDVEELVCVDMAAVGAGQTSDEFHTTLCVKDSGGPYSHALSQRLRRLADLNAIPYKVDIYPFYGSDGEAFWRAGGDVALALIGPGVDASHNYERTHTEALVATTQWILAYLLEK
jgi:putative aminopeptidase FrvX